MQTAERFLTFVRNDGSEERKQKGRTTGRLRVNRNPKQDGELIFDHCAIYLLIAGTYTPFLFVNLRGGWG